MRRAGWKTHKTTSSSYSQGFLKKHVKRVRFDVWPWNQVNKNTCLQYMKNLAVTRGLGDPGKDKHALDLIYQFAIHRRDTEGQIKYLDKLKDDQGRPMSRNLKVYSESEEAMERFTRPNHSTFRWNSNYQSALKTVERLVVKKLTLLQYNSDDDILQALPKRDTHSGFMYLETGHKKKGENIEGLLDEVKIHARRSVVNGNFGLPIMIEFRTQASGEYEDDGTQTNKCKHKLRVVSMYDLRNIAIEMMWSNPFQDHFGDLQQYAGGKPPTSISTIIFNYQTGRPYWATVDYSAYDQTMSDWMIEDAFSIIKKCFPSMSEDQSQLFDVMVQSFIHKTFLCAEGCVKSDRGVPSGSMWTQIIDTLVNLIMVHTYMLSIGSDCSMIAMGDDNSIFTGKELDREDMGGYLSHNFGVDVNLTKFKHGGPGTYVNFLSREWRPGGQYRHPYQLLSRLYFYERERIYTHDWKMNPLPKRRELKGYKGPPITPWITVWNYVQTYPLGMAQLIDVDKFRRMMPYSEDELNQVMDSIYAPGSMTYIREYTMRKRNRGR